MPITAAGSILPKNATRGGVFLLAGNRMNLLKTQVLPPFLKCLQRSQMGAVSRRKLDREQFIIDGAEAALTHKASKMLTITNSFFLYIFA